jgi:hypothetical protein
MSNGRRSGCSIARTPAEATRFISAVADEALKIAGTLVKLGLCTTGP